MTLLVESRASPPGQRDAARRDGRDARRSIETPVAPLDDADPWSLLAQQGSVRPDGWVHDCHM